MNTDTVIMAIVFVFAVVTIIAFIRYRGQGSAFFKWLGIELKVSGKNTVSEQKSGINAMDVTVREGGLRAEETDGKGINIERIDTKDDVVLSSGRQQQESNTRQESMRPNLVYANGLSAGGDIQIFLNDLGIGNHRFSQFASSQFEAYNNTWKKLQALRMAGDNLWEKVSTDNLYEFSQQLRQVKILALEGDIYFEDEHREKLNGVLQSLGRFRVGKQYLSEIRRKETIEDFMGFQQEEIRYRVESNRKAKKEYEQLLDEIRIAFRNKLSKL